MIPKTLKRILLLPLLMLAAFVNVLFANPFAETMGLSPIHDPSATVGPQTEKYLSLLDIQKPSIRNTLIRRFGDQGLGMLDVIQSLGYESPVEQTEFSHFEEDWIIETFTSDLNVADPGTGNPITITLTASNVDSSGRYYPRLWDDVLFPNQVTGKIYNINTGGATPVLTIYPHTSNDNIGAITSGQEISIYSNGFPEGSDTPAGRLSKVSKITYGCKILMESFEVTNTELTNRKWITVMSDGQDIGGYHIKGQLDAEYRLRVQSEGAFLFDRPVTNATLVAQGHRNMTGLIPEIRTKGLNGSYTGGFFSIPLFYQMQKKQKKFFAGSEFIGFLGVDLENEWEQLFTDFFAENPIVFSKQGNQPVKDLEIGFTSIKIGGQTYHIKSMDIFNHPKLFNIPGYDLTGMGIITPNKMAKDAKTKDNIPCIGMRYKAMDGYSRKLRIWNTGGGNNMSNNQPTDKNKMNMVSEIGAEWMALNKFFLWERG
jgi:hypothetical protein